MKKIVPLFVIGLVFVGGLTAGAGSFSVQRKKPLFASLDAYDMVCIAPEQFSSALTPLIEHKDAHGIQTLLKTTESIYDEYDGFDEAEEVKLFIKDAIEQMNVSYVLLVGGRYYQFNKWHVPVRYVNLDDGFVYPEYLSDLYFADIYKNGNEFDDWDSNDDNVYAEWGKDTLDLEPDVHVGRLACRNTREVRTVVEKIITYETTASGSTWTNTIVAIAGDTFPDYSGEFPYEGEETCDVALSYMDGYEKIRLYGSTGNLTSDADVVNAFNDGCGFVLTRGRGGTDRIRVVNLEGSELIVLQNKLIPTLQNTEMYPICVLDECWHGKFDVCLMNILKLLREEPDIQQTDCIPWCIAWWLVKRTNGGAVATITNTNTCFGTFGDANDNDIIDDAEQFGGYLGVEFFRQIGQEGKQTIGEAITASLINYINILPVHTNKYHCKSVQEWVLLGDPSLKIGGYA